MADGQTHASPIQDLIHSLINATNGFDVEAALRFFAADAFIDDLSVGGRFEGLAGVRSYIKQFFVGYETATRILSVEMTDESHAIVRFDLHGYFGHETGAMEISINADGLITAVNANVR